MRVTYASLKSTHAKTHNNPALSPLHPPTYRLPFLRRMLIPCKTYGFVDRGCQGCDEKGLGRRHAPNHHARAESRAELKRSRCPFVLTWRSP